LFVFDDQTHMVRYPQTQGRSLRAVAQGPGAASANALPTGWTTNPFNPLGQLDEGGSPWRPWNPDHLLNYPDRVLLHPDIPPNAGSEFFLVKYIQRMFVKSQVTVSVLSNANLGSILEPGQTMPRPPKSITENLGVEKPDWADDGSRPGLRQPDRGVDADAGAWADLSRHRQPPRQ